MAGAGSKCEVHLQLIEAVREHEVLYNPELKEYNDNILKMRLWRLIARKCDIPTGEDAKKIWKNLRDGFRCSIKTLKLYENKEPPRPLKPWKYVDEMEFLRPFMKDRVFSNAAYYEGEYDYDIRYKNSSSKDDRDSSTVDSSDAMIQGGSCSGGDNSVNSLEETIECRPDIAPSLLHNLQETPPAQPLPHLNPHESHDCYEIPIKLIKREHTSPLMDITDVSAMSQLEALAARGLSQSFGTAGQPNVNLGPPPKKRGRKKKTDIEIMFTSQTPPGLLQDHGHTFRELENGDGMEDSLKLFFDSMYTSTKALPPTLQRVVRIKLFQTVTDAEMAAESMAIGNPAALIYGQQLQELQQSQQQHSSCRTNSRGDYDD